MWLFKIILNYKLHVYLVSSIHSFNYGSFVTRLCLNARVISEQDLNKLEIFKPDYSSCIRESENSSSEFTKRVVQNCPTKNVDNQVTFSHPYWIMFKCKVLFLYSFEYIFLSKSLEKKLKKKASANFEAFRYSFYLSITFKVGTVAIFYRRGY